MKEREGGGRRGGGGGGGGRRVPMTKANQNFIVTKILSVGDNKKRRKTPSTRGAIFIIAAEFSK